MNTGVKLAGEIKLTLDEISALSWPACKAFNIFPTEDLQDGNNIIAEGRL